ncbi:MAG: M48 family metallopeptidase [Quisquiliibacterium sp.]|jgi:predicted metal-dependent hydrolase
MARNLVDAARQLALSFGEPSTSQTPASRPGGRMARLNGEFVEYTLRRSKRKTIGLLIDDRGLVISAPKWVPQAEIDSTLQQRADWIARKLIDWREHAARREQLAIRWEPGASLPFLGARLTLRVDPAHKGSPRVDGSELILALPPGAGSEQIRDSVQSWLQKQARTHFGPRIEHFAELLGTRPSRWSLSSARTRWGSCNADGSIRLNWRLMHFPPDIIDYVIAHELAHLRELNHGDGFWRTVGELFPDYQRVRGMLREYTDDISIS